MQNRTFYFIGPDREIRENPGLAPAGLLARQHFTADAPVFRFGFEPGRIFIQDESFRRRLKDGDKDAWSFLNFALENLSKTKGARFLDRVYGDPIDSGVQRKMSDYKDAWEYLDHAMMEEFGLHPFDITVYEYVPSEDQRNDTVKRIEDETRCIGVNRYVNRVLGTGPDVDIDAISGELEMFYLENLRWVCDVAKGNPQAAWLLKQIDSASDKHMFAMLHEGRPRIFKAKKEADGTLGTEADIRASLKGYDGPIIIFSFDRVKNVLYVRNHPLGRLYEDPSTKEMIETIRRDAAKVAGVPPHRTALAFDPSLMEASLFEMSRYAAPWSLVRRHFDQPRDVEVLCAPLRSHAGGAGAVIRGELDEDMKCPRLKLFRAARGLAPSYPYILVDSREPRGAQARVMLDCYFTLASGHERDDAPAPLSEFVMMARDKHARNAIKCDMEHLLNLGLGKKDLLDFFAPDRDLARRAEYRQIAEELIDSLSKSKVVVAGLGGINDWFYATQEKINESRHVNDQGRRTVEPFNLQKKKKAPSPRSYEQLLMTQHDKDLSAEKTTEQLLRESLI